MSIAAIIGVILLSMKLKFVAVMLIALIAANFFASSLNSLITGIFPMFMRERGNSGMFAGIINGFCYLGSTISSYGLGSVADHFGWTAVFWTLLGVCEAVCLVWCSYAAFKHFLKSKGQGSDVFS